MSEYDPVERSTYPDGPDPRQPWIRTCAPSGTGTHGSGQPGDPKQTPAAAGPPTVCARWKAQPRRSGPSGIRKPRSLQRTEGTIKPSPIRPAVESGFAIDDDFAYDDQTGTLTCPNGVTSPLSAQRRVTFGAAC